ncbi:MAG: L-seryl-tRNA(Sec) selenium transferase [bacterium]
MDQNELRKIPGVDRLLGARDIAGYVAEISQPIVAEVIRAKLEELRNEVAKTGKCPDYEEIVGRVCGALSDLMNLFMREAINATGVIIHTNLGRAPLGREVVEKISRVAGGYSNLEYNIAKGERGFRGDLQETLLTVLTGAEEAVIVNNCAGALFLVLTQYAKGREAIISRGELVQIGGGFRVPEIMEESGALLREVGSTNQTTIDDFRDAANKNTGLLLKVHHSNFLLQGFVASPTDKEIAELAAERGVPFVYDVGSGAIYDTEKFGLEHEPTAQDAIRGGADIICFSGDKLLGGPQAGIIIGKKKWVAPLKKHPLFRALRPDKLCLAALEQTLIHYLKGEANEKIPILKMMAAKPDELEKRAGLIAAKLKKKSIAVSVTSGESAVGGGSLPGRTLPTRLLSVRTKVSPDKAAAKLRRGNPPVISRIVEDAVCFDLRTVPEERDAELAGAIIAALL